MNTFKNEITAAPLRLLLTSIGVIYAFKILALAVRPRPRTASGLAAFLLAWPGVNAAPFMRHRASLPIDAPRFFAAWVRTAMGMVTMLLLAIYSPVMPATILGPAGVAAILLTVHAGLCDLLPWLLRWAGFNVPLLFDRPWASVSLADFWSRPLESGIRRNEPVLPPAVPLSPYRQARRTFRTLRVIRSVA